VHGLGSGKTLEGIAAQEALGMPADVVVPAPLVENYKKEIEKHTRGARPDTRIRSYQKAVMSGGVDPNRMVIADEAHRMRNPLNVIQMCAQYLKTHFDTSDERKEVALAIEEKVKVLEQLTRDFVEYSRASRIRKSPEYIEKLADEVIKNCAPRCKIQGVEVLRRYEPHLPIVHVDADLIKEVITNIIDNALEAMKGPGKVGVIVQQDKASHSLIVSISNTGGVLPEDLQEKIFEPFFTTKETGMGLGLAIVKQVIDGHGGKILATGDPRTNSTTFRIQLPLTEKPVGAS
jgi:signal transduction histidine kinase